MEKAWFTGGSIAASGNAPSPGSIDLVRARSISITAAATFHASATGDVRVDVYYSPDGRSYDTLTFTTFDLTVSQGNYVQKTVIIDPPEHGYIVIKLVNEDATYAVTDHRAWYSVAAWQPFVRWEELAKGEITTPSDSSD